jgi:uncharacterized protein (DUF433 family)
MERITFVSGLRGGRPTIRGMRITVTDILDMLGNGMSEAEILESFPFLEREDILAALLYAARELDHPVVAGGAVAAE